jgi:hypothetical protein
MTRRPPLHGRIYGTVLLACLAFVPAAHAQEDPSAVAPSDSSNAVAPSASQPAGPSLPKGSVWHMDETSGSSMTDAGSGGAKGDLKNVQLGAPGFQGSGYRFTGKSVVVLKSSTLNPGSSNFQITVHVNFTTKPSSSVGDYDLFRKGLSSSKGGDYKVEILGSGKAFCMMIGSSGSASLTAGSNLADGKWHTIQCLRQGSKISLVVDGKSSSTSGNIGSISNSAKATLGAKSSSGSGDQYTGLMDEVSWSLI